jgi:hypothetical protein
VEQDEVSIPREIVEGVTATKTVSFEGEGISSVFDFLAI